MFRGGGSFFFDFIFHVARVLHDKFTHGRRFITVLPGTIFSQYERTAKSAGGGFVTIRHRSLVAQVNVIHWRRTEKIKNRIIFRM